MNESIGNGFYRTETNKATWEVPERYQELLSIGSGAYGLVWYDKITPKLFTEKLYFVVPFHMYCAVNRADNTINFQQLFK